MTAEPLLQCRPIRLRTDCAVGDRHRHVGSSGPQFLRQEVTGHLGARNEDPGAFHVFLFDRFQHPFRLILFGNQVSLESLPCQSLGCPRSDRTEPCAPQGTRVPTEGAQPVEEKPHAIDAGKDHPVVPREVGDRPIERTPIGRRDNRNRRHGEDAGARASQ